MPGRFGRAEHLLGQADLQTALDTQQKLDPGQAVEAQFPIQIGVYPDLNMGQARPQFQSQPPDDLEQLTPEFGIATRFVVSLFCHRLLPDLMIAITWTIQATQPA